MPIVMVALMLAPALLLTMSSSDAKIVAVVDDSGVVAGQLHDTDEVHFVSPEQPRDSILTNSSLFGVLIIDKDILQGTPSVKLFTNSASSLIVETSIQHQLEDILESEKLKAYDIENLDSILADIRTPINIYTFRNDPTGTSKTTSTGISYALGVAMTFILYMFMLLYGQMVMTSIIEEKNNRVLEIMVSSIKPRQLMLGKITGIGLVAVTQIAIWIALITAISGLVIPAIVPSDLMSQASALGAGTLDQAAMGDVDTDILQALSIVGNVGYLLQMFGYMLIFLIGGFMLYSSVYAAVGSAVDNIQDAGQLQSFVVVPIIIGLVFAMTAATDPNSLMAVILSIIPFTSPMVMMVRIPFNIPTWEIITSIIVLYASFFVMVWIAAKIYRVGIFMYGKKPTFRDLIRWARYK
jgi:ABC-2 type transport system permease protein